MVGLFNFGYARSRNTFHNYHANDSAKKEMALLGDFALLRFHVWVSYRIKTRIRIKARIRITARIRVTSRG